ncbi:MAG: hypothetical protein H6922_04215 [Pseudomonadaceae bacterium]|nr:hypothetical protein [Pseudomonadaceae bacterium]
MQDDPSLVSLRAHLPNAAWQELGRRHAHELRLMADAYNRRPPVFVAQAIPAHIHLDKLPSPRATSAFVNGFQAYFAQENLRGRYVRQFKQNPDKISLMVCPQPLASGVMRQVANDNRPKTGR